MWPLTVLSGRSPICAIVSGVALTTTGYSLTPIFAVPAGSTRSCSPTAVATSRGEMPDACSRSGSMSIMIMRCLPPYGYGICAPGTVAISARTKLTP